MAQVLRGQWLKKTVEALLIDRGGTGGAGRSVDFAVPLPHAHLQVIAVTVPSGGAGAAAILGETHACGLELSDGYNSVPAQLTPACLAAFTGAGRGGGGFTHNRPLKSIDGGLLMLCRLITFAASPGSPPLRYRLIAWMWSPSSSLRRAASSSWRVSSRYW